MTAIKAASRDLGKTCKACHDKYRAEMNIERGRRDQPAVWDLPVRLVHWLLAALIAVQLVVGREPPHRLAHLVGLRDPDPAVFRLLWGFVGSSTARFASFVRGPRAVLDYCAAAGRGIGHTPLGALSVVALLGAVAIQVGLGLSPRMRTASMRDRLPRLVSIDTSD